jgi:tetratricopeptide (TPR) repeat protein/GGDEF domain-containing protein
VPNFHSTREEFAAAAAPLVAAATAKAPTVLLVGEIDGFAELAELYGARGADDLHGAVTDVVSRLLRSDAVVGRGPAGQILIMLGSAGAEEGRQVGERLCASIRMHAFPRVDGKDAPRMTLSFGAASVPEHGADYDAVFALANAAQMRLVTQGADGAAAAPLAHHQALHRQLSVDRFAGRAQEFTSLVQWLDDACTGRPRLVTVLGDVGTGTAALLRQLEPEVRLRGGAFVSASCVDSTVREPYGVWAGVMTAINRLPNAATRQWRELPNLFPELGPPDEPEPGAGSQYRFFKELTEYVRGAASARPLVLLFDEMQWADAASWDALQYMLSHLDSDRIMICLALRSDASFAETGEFRKAVGRHEFARELTLSRLTRDELKQWLEGAFHRQQVGREFLAFIYRHTEGNPLFISQLLHALLEDGALWHSGTRWEWSPVSELRIPPGLAPLVEKRIGRFSSSTQAVLTTAATIGREFDVGLLVASGAGSEAAVKLALQEALGAGLIKPTYERRHGGYAFSHDLVASVLVGAVPRERLAQLHERVGQALEQRESRRPAEIALHYDRAGATAPAYKFALAAATRAERVYAPIAAIDYLHMAARNATSPSELAEVRVALAELSEKQGRYDEVEELCDLAIEWFAGHGDRRRALTLRRMRERARMELGQPAKVTLANLLALDQEAKDVDFARERVTILAMASQTHGRLGDPKTARDLAKEGVDMAEGIGDPSLLGEALVRYGVTVSTESREQARQIYERALALFESAADVRGQSRCHNNIGVMAQFQHDLPLAEESYSRALTLAKGAGMPDLWGIAALNLGVLSNLTGHYDRAREQFAEAIELFAAVKHSENQLIALYNMAHVERDLALWEAAAELYEATAPLAQRIGQSDVEIGALAGAGLCLLELGRVDAARGNYREVEERMRTRSTWFQNRELVDALAVRVAILDGRIDEALERLNMALELAEPTDLYGAVLLNAMCAEPLVPHRVQWVRESVRKYAPMVERLGYAEMTRRYKELAER